MSFFLPLGRELRSYLPKDKVDFLYKVYLVAEKAHSKQKRYSHQPYITHPVAVAKILAEMHMGVESIAAAILHDILEDTTVTKKELEKQFGKEIVKLVDGVSKLAHIKFESRIEAQAENFRKMLMAMVDDIRVILIKLADRLHNIQTLHYSPVEKQRRIAKETLEIYVPIANRLGMHNFRLNLEELSFSQLYPLRFRVLLKAVQKARGNRKAIIDVIECSLKDALENMNLECFELVGREKHLYSIYNKMRRKHLQFSEIMDVYGFRIIVKDVDSCYRILGAVHNLYKPFPKRFKDYIAIPKVNGYQSLHTILFGPYGLPIEIQIRTIDMDRMAENGIAAHWLYKSDANVVDQAQLRAREWIKGLLEIQQSAGNSLEFIENVKIDLFPDEVYVFTPLGDIMELPNGATAVDFAYSVHSDIGNHCIAVKIDRRLAPLSEKLANGQTVEIITSLKSRPNPAWLDFVVAGKARSKIRHYLKHQRLQESAELGKVLLENALSKLDSTLEDIEEDKFKKVLSSSGFKSKKDLFESIGLGNQLAQLVVKKLLGRSSLLKAGVSSSAEKPLCIKGSEGIVISFAKCCRPIPGDPIEGVLTAGRGIVVHNEACGNLRESHRQPDKCIPLRWEDKVYGEFEVELHINVISRRGILATLALVITDAEANIDNINVDEGDGRFNIVKLIIKVRNRKHLSDVIRRIRGIRYVKKIVRYNGNVFS